MCQDALHRNLPENNTLTHLLLRHVFRRAKTSQANLGRAVAFAQASKTLRWIGIEVNRVLRCWEVVHSKQEESSGKDVQTTTLVNTSEMAGRQVIAKEQMDKFRSYDGC